jgi:hypothetical protein
LPEFAPLDVKHLITKREFHGRSPEGWSDSISQGIIRPF